MSRGDIVILSGPPGAGKSTLARALADVAPAPGGLHLRGDDLLFSIRAGYVQPWDPASMLQNQTLSRALAGVAATFAEAGYRTALDWVVGPWFLDIYRRAAADVGAVLHYVLLLPSQDIAAARARDRAEAPVADYAILDPLYQQLAAPGALDAHKLDTSSHLVDESLAHLQHGLEAERFRLL